MDSNEKKYDERQGFILSMSEFLNSRFQVILKIREDTDGIIPLKDRIQRMVTGQITDQMGKPVTASPVSTSIQYISLD